MTRRELDVFAAVADAVVAPLPPLPPVGATDAAAAFDDAMRRAPALNRLGLRAGLLALELAPRLMRTRPPRRRLRQLDRAERTEVLLRLDRTALAPVLKAVRSIAHLSYYGDLGVMAQLGYDPAAVLERAAAVRRGA